MKAGWRRKIRAFVTNILANHHSNPVIKTRYDNALKSDAELIDLVVDQIGSGTGGPMEYKEMSMLEAHRGMNVSEAEFVAVLDDMLAALNKHKVGEIEKAELLAIAYGMKEEIVRG